MSGAVTTFMFILGALTVDLGTITTEGDGRVLIWVCGRVASGWPDWTNYGRIAAAQVSAASAGPSGLKFTLKRNGVALPQHTLSYSVSNLIRFDTRTSFSDAPGPGVTASYSYEVETSAGGSHTSNIEILPLDVILMEIRK